VVFIDLDKGINEVYGHEAADSVLITTAKSIASAARDTDCVARYGATEFVIVLPGLASSGAKIFYERLMARLRSTVHTISGAVVTVGASVGLATHAPKKPFQRVSHLINAAERSARSAKKSRRDLLVRHKSGAPVPAAST
jgi:diguanylate cyclase (GGDEF)-like protein